MKRKLSKIIAVFLSILMLFGSFPALALTEGNSYSYKEQYLDMYYDTGRWETANGDVHDNYGQIALRNLTSTGEPLYCIQIYEGCDGSAATAEKIQDTTLWDRELTSVARSVMTRISIYGYKNYTYGYSSVEAQLATQILLWETEIGARTNYNASVTSFAKNINATTSSAKRTLSAALECYLEILEACQNHSNRPDFGTTTVELDFIDAELEQMICGHSMEFNAEDFIKRPTAIFLICPDEDTSRHFFASLFIRYFTTQLIDMAEASPNQTLPRKVLCLWDEFGNMPAIKDVDSLFTAARSRGIRFLYSIQSFSQLKKSYNKTFEEIILDSSQMLMFTYVAPTAYDTAKRLSDILGSKTVLSGTVARRTRIYNILDEDNTATYQMIKRPLMLPEEIMSIPIGTFIVIKTGGTSEQIRMKTKLPMYSDYCNVYPEYKQNIEFKFKEIKVLDSEKIRMLGALEKNKLTLGMFD